MPVYDYQCRCGQRDQDLYYATWRSAPARRRCSRCNHRTSMKVIGTKNFIHPSHSGLYGRPEPALGGEVIQDYAHKQRLLKELGAIEASDRVHGAKLYQDANRPEPRQGSQLTWGNPPPIATE